MQLYPLYTTSVANNNREEQEMTAFTLSYASPATTEQNNSVRQPAWPARPSAPCRQLWEQDAERAFEAGVQWFLAVSRAA